MADAIAVRIAGRDVIHRARREAREARELLGAGVAVGVRGPASALAYSAESALVVSGPAVVGCDVAEVTARSEQVWRDLLTPLRFALAMRVGAESGEDLQRSCTRLWCAAECLIKAGTHSGAPLVLRSVDADGWTTFRSGADVIATYVATPHDYPGVLVLAVMLRGS